MAEAVRHVEVRSVVMDKKAKVPQKPKTAKPKDKSKVG